MHSIGQPEDDKQHRTAKFASDSLKEMVLRKYKEQKKKPTLEKN